MNFFLKSIENLETKPPRVSILELKNKGFLKENQSFFNSKKEIIGILKNDKIDDGKNILSIHKMAAKHLNKTNHNGWDYFYILESDQLISLNTLRYRYFKKNN